MNYKGAKQRKHKVRNQENNAKQDKAEKAPLLYKKNIQVKVTKQDRKFSSIYLRQKT